jgi:three-Cys-motif partner protein
MSTKNFYDEATESSKVKIAIVEKYFKAWAKIILGSQEKNEVSDKKLAYIDLFAGPGSYKDGTISTPLLILKDAIADERLQKRLVTKFNDINKEYIDELEQAASKIPDIDKLEYPPIFSNREIGEKIVEEFKTTRFMPTLSFIDPWGYKGLSLDLILVTVRDWGCDCILFFNYNRIATAINNGLVKEHIDSLFGQEGAKKLQEELNLDDNSGEKELKLIEYFCNVVKESGRKEEIKYVLPFRFKSERAERTSHYLIFISKSIIGYKIMKEIMYKSSSEQDQGIGSFEFAKPHQGIDSFEYIVATSQQPFLFGFKRDIQKLSEDFLTCFADKTLKVEQIIKEAYGKYYVDTPYIQKSYREVLKLLESKQKVQTDPPANKRRKINKGKNKGEVTFGDTVKVTFPSKKQKE